jgi:hypothetical protein
MFRSVRLEPLTTHERPLVFEWDTDSGSVRGRDAARVRALAEDAARARTILGHPYPTPYELADPLRRPAELAVVLGNDWRLDDFLQAAYPAADGDDLLIEIDSEGQERSSEFRPLY